MLSCTCGNPCSQTTPRSRIAVSKGTCICSFVSSFQFPLLGHCLALRPPTLVWETVGSPKFSWLLCCCKLLRWKCRLYHQTSGFKSWFCYKMLWGHWANCLTTQFRQITPTPLQLSRVMAASAPTAAWASLHSHPPHEDTPNWEQTLRPRHPSPCPQMWEQ